MLKLHNQNKRIGAALLACIAVAAAPAVFALTAPTAPYNTMGAQAYDIIFNKGYNSGLGYVLAGGMGLFGFMQLKNNWKEAVGWGAGATGVGVLPSIVTAFGYMY
jgi:hypothetical protein